MAAGSFISRLSPMKKQHSPAQEARPSSNPRKELIREKLLDGAAHLFIRNGYSNTRIQDIAEELGLSRSTLYHYFPKKDDILLALIEDVAARSVLRLEAMQKDKTLTAAERLTGMITGNILSKLEGGARFRMLDRIEAELPDEIRAAFAKTRRRVLDLTIDIIQSGVDSGEFRGIDAKVAAFAVIGMSNWTAWWYSPDGDHSPRQIVDTMSSFALAALAAQGAPAGPANLGDALAKMAGDLQALRHQYLDGLGRSAEHHASSARKKIG